ncbi:DUF732 domain-containing protein [Mycobacterium sp. LTG2003]
MTARAILPLVAAVTAGALTAAPANADPVDDSFIAALNSAGVSYNDPAAAVALGQQVCPMLVEPGKSFASVATKLRGDRSVVSPDVAAFFTGIAISMYCPQMMSSIGDGTLLRMLAVPGLTALRP